MASDRDIGIALLALQSKIISPGQLTETLAEAQGDSSPDAITQRLVKKGLLNPSELTRLTARVAETPTLLRAPATGGTSPSAPLPSDGSTVGLPPAESGPAPGAIRQAAAGPGVTEREHSTADPSDARALPRRESAGRGPIGGSATVVSPSDAGTPVGGAPVAGAAPPDLTATPPTMQVGRAGIEHVARDLAPPGGMMPTVMGPARRRATTASGWPVEDSAPAPDASAPERQGAFVAQEAQPAPPTEADVGLLGRRYHDFQILKELGHGGMGVVYEAEQVSLRRRVALKVLPSSMLSDRVYLERFKQEARSAAKLRHPNIVQVYESGEHEGHHYIAMELVSGRSLAEVIKQERVTPRRAATLAHALAKALEYAHAQGVIHRDVKPTNVLVGKEDHVFLMDFGLAREGAGEGLTESGTVIGTPVYMAPEQARGEVADEQVDVYGVGVVMYELLSGQPPFAPAAFLSVIKAVMEDEPAPPRSLVAAVPRDLETVTLKAMDKSKERRYHSMTALRADLGRWLEGEPVVARPVSIVGKLVRKARKNRGATALGAVALAVLLVALGLWWRGHARDMALAREKVAEFRSLRAKGDASSSRAAYEALAQAITLSGEAEEYLCEKSKARMEDVQALMKGEDWKGAEGALELLKEADAKVGLYAKELAELDRRITGIGSLELHTDPEGATYKIYDFNEKGLWDIQQDPKKWLLAEGVTPMPKKPWPMGDYLIMFSGSGYAPANYPVSIGRNEDEGDAVRMLAANKLPLGMVYVPSGEVVPRKPGESERARPLDVPGFLIDANEVSQREYSRVLLADQEEGRHHVPREDDGTASWQGLTPLPGWDDLPVFGVTAEDAQFYARSLGGRLPYRDEMMRAACGADGRYYPWGNQLDEGRIASPASIKFALPVAPTKYSSGLSPFGCTHMVGNVSEWCMALRQAHSEVLVVVGGSYKSDHRDEFMLSAGTLLRSRITRSRGIGFRIVRPVE